MGYHIKRDDGLYLVGPGSTRMDDKPGCPFQSITAAMRAIDRYRLSIRVFTGRDASVDGFSILSD